MSAASWANWGRRFALQGVLQETRGYATFGCKRGLVGIGPMALSDNCALSIIIPGAVLPLIRLWLVPLRLARYLTTKPVVNPDESPGICSLPVL